MNSYLKQIYQSFDPTLPPLPEFYVEMAGINGLTSLSDHFQRRLSLSRPKTSSFLITGHAGCGKSTELRHLGDVLGQGGNDNQPHYLVAYLDANDYLDDFDVHLEDIVLAVAVEVEKALKGRPHFRFINSCLLNNLEELKNHLVKDFEIEAKDFGTDIATRKIQGLKNSSVMRKRIREILQPKLHILLENINQMILKARQGIDNKAQETLTDVVLIVDNLNKIHRFENYDIGIESYHQLFIEQHSIFTNIALNLILAVPLELARSKESYLLAQYYDELLALPLTKITKRDDWETEYLPGISRQVDFLEKRLSSILPLEQVFDDDALNFLIKYSGGHARSLISIINRACTFTDNLPFSLFDIQMAIHQAIQGYASSLSDLEWKKLARLHGSPSSNFDHEDRDFLLLLHNLCILEYTDGGEGDSPFSMAEPWYLVHPIIRNLEYFEYALDRCQDTYS
jgi:hypothetical protein